MNIFSVLLGIAFVMGFFTLGVFFLVGTWQKWPSFVSPPDEEWGFYSQSFIKKIFGQNGLIFFNYCFGMLCVLFSLIGLLNGVKDLLSP